MEKRLFASALARSITACHPLRVGREHARRCPQLLTWNAFTQARGMYGGALPGVTIMAASPAQESRESESLENPRASVVLDSFLQVPQAVAAAGFLSPPSGE